MFWFLSQKSKKYLNKMQHSKPVAKALIKGSKSYSGIIGTAYFFQTSDGVLLSVEAAGLPQKDERCIHGIFGFHIHEGESCTGSYEDPFSDTKMHYNPDECAHPNHAGDLPPLFENKGHAYMAVLTDRFSVKDIIGKTMVIHRGPDDFTTQPAGNAGKKIACGIIKKT